MSEHVISSFDQRSYQSPGPVASAFLIDRTEVRGLMGPFGSGKTNVIIFDALTCAFQMPKALDGNRYFRGIILRDNYTNLWKTMIPSWWGWFPKKIGEWSGGNGRQAEHKLTFDHPDGSLIFVEMWFLAIQENNVENVLRGIEFTWGNINEADLVTDDVLPYMLQRVLQRRYPSVHMMGIGNTNYFAGITLDFNPPDMDNYLYELFEEDRPEGHILFKQPSGLSDKAENRNAIPKSVYEQMARVSARKEWLVKRMVRGEFAHSRSANPVYENYIDSIHCAKEKLRVLPGLRLHVGFDQGIRGPAMIIAQWTTKKQLRVLKEFVPGRISPSVFAERCLTILQTEFSECEIQWNDTNKLVEQATCDPAGKDGEIKEEGHSSWLSSVEDGMGLIIGTAESNEIDIRIDGVDQLLSNDIERDLPAIIICPIGCKMLRKGFNSHYNYKKRIVGNTSSIDPKPQKNEYADPHDALQYLVQSLMGLDAVIEGLLTGTFSRGNQTGSKDDYEEETSHQLDTSFDVHGV